MDQHGLANAGTAEQANLAALAVGRQQVDHLDAGLKHLGLGLQLSEEGGGAVDRSGLGGGYWTLLIHRLAEHVEDATEGGLAHRYADWGARINCFHATHQAIGGAHGHSTDSVIAQQLLNLSREGD